MIFHHFFIAVFAVYGFVSAVWDIRRYQAFLKYADPAIVFPARKKVGNPELAKLSLVFPF